MFDRVYCVSATEGAAPFIAFANYSDAYSCARELAGEGCEALITQPPLFYSWSVIEQIAGGDDG